MENSLQGFGQYGLLGLVLGTFLMFGWIVYKDQAGKYTAKDEELRTLHDKYETTVLPVLVQVLEILKDLEEIRRHQLYRARAKDDGGPSHE